MIWIVDWQLTGSQLVVNNLQHSTITIDSIVNILVSTNSDSRWLMVGSSLAEHPPPRPPTRAAGASDGQGMGM